MAEQHPMFDRANQDTAAEIVRKVTTASKAEITGYDEGNPGSTHLLRVHTTSGTVWVNPTHVYVPNTLRHVEGYPTEAAYSGLNYFLPNMGQRSSSRPNGGASMTACPSCFIQHPFGTACPYCAE
jgi:hypothetical protein